MPSLIFVLLYFTSLSSRHHLPAYDVTHAQQTRTEIEHIK
jgi:hypothetical protein